jgi:hypothetical protein
MEGVVIIVHDARDPSRRLFPLIGQEQLAVGMLKKGIFFDIQLLFDVRNQGRHPMGIVPIDPPGKPDELAKVFIGLDCLDPKGGHVFPSIFPILPNCPSFCTKKKGEGYAPRPGFPSCVWGGVCVNNIREHAQLQRRRP